MKHRNNRRREKYHELLRWAIAERVRHGQKVETVARQTGISESRIRAFCIEHNVRPRYRRVITPERAEELRRMWKENMPVKEMAAKTGIDVGTILSYAQIHRDEFAYRYNKEGKRG